MGFNSAFKGLTAFQMPVSFHLEVFHYYYEGSKFSQKVAHYQTTQLHPRGLLLQCGVWQSM